MGKLAEINRVRAARRRRDIQQNGSLRRNVQPPMTFSQRIREAMTEAKINGKDLAQKAGFHYYTLSSYLMGKRDPSALYLFKLVKVLGISADYFRDCVSSRADHNVTGKPGRPKRAG